MHQIIKKLEGSDLRSKGRSEEVVKDILNKPSLFKHVILAILDDDPVIRMRAADAAEKISKEQPTYLRPYKKILINRISHIDQQEVRWHAAQMLPRLQLTSKERRQVWDIFLQYLKDKSSIVRAFAMQGLADIAMKDQSYLQQVVPLINKLMVTGSPAMQSRGCKLLKQLERQ